MSSTQILVLTASLSLLQTGSGQSSSEAPSPTRPPKQESVADIAQTVRPSLVKVTQVGREGPFGVGSGFVFSADGLIATNRHVIGEARRLKVETSDGRQHEVTEIVASDARLDLAILRVATTGLVPLELGDSESLRQGEPIVAMGNPEGLAFSVVEGVISEPNRDVEGLPMIQVAVPIERGNSGGPLLDRQARVLGVLTLKSARTENLGFAMPVNALKKLLSKPNPVPMERWLTIGVLNPRFWQTLLGAQWTQRAGVIHVSQPGDGFGGRSLCLWMENPPEATFEATVTVRLNDESGAAGLTFCADGQNRHYGFYPTGGKLRLTRFDGPNVFSWKILQDLDSPAYRPGDWNRLRVRVEGTRILCFVNETQVMDLDDDGLRGGQAGLCKFRQTEASFKNFRLGSNLAEKPLPLEITREVKESMEALLSGRIPAETALDTFVLDPDSSRRLITERQRSLEKEAALLKDLGADLHRRAIREELAAELSKPEEQADLLRSALLLSKHDNPELDVESYEHGFGLMVRELQTEPEITADTGSAVNRLTRYLFEENGFHGSRSDYGNRSNSYINEVLDDREGLPITLSVVYLELARRLGIQGVAGIPLPTRFMVGHRNSATEPFSLVDVYDGGKALRMQEAVDLVSPSGLVPESSKRPASKRDIILRMIRNLIGQVNESRNSAPEMLPYLDLVLALDPAPNSERLTRALLREKLGDRAGARTDVLWLMEHLPESLTEEQRETLHQWLERLSR